MSLVSCCMCVFVLTVICQSLPKVQVSPTTNTFHDGQGHTLFFHGTSQVNKEATIDNGLIYYNTTQLQQLRDYGFKAIRLGFLWNAYETAPGIFNEQYMNGIENITKLYAEYGIRTILDMHQDLWSPLFCGGHGIPEFYSYPDNSTTQYWENGNRSYPQPHFAPHGYIPPNEDPYANVYGHVDDTTCSWMVSNTTVGWAASYTTYALSNTVQRLYDNVDQYQTKFAENFWYRVAEKFKDNPGILGYELINEPWVGDVFNYPELYAPKACDVINLRSLYKYLNDMIRIVDNDTIIFYEPCTGGNDLDATPCGFDTGPGGAGYDNKQSLSYHIYCPLIQTDVPITNDTVFNQTLLDACYEINDLQWYWRLDDTKRLKTAGFLTEFGAVPYTELGFKLIDYEADMADDNLVSWTYWYLNMDSERDTAQVPSITRTYAYQVASMDVKRMRYNVTDKSFLLEYIMDVMMVEKNLTTKVYFSYDIHYPNGVDYNVKPEGYVDVMVNYKENEIILIPSRNPQNNNTLLTFNLYAK